MSPYRDLARCPDRPIAGADREERILYGALMVIGGIPVALALLRASAFGSEATFGAMMLMWGALGLGRARRQRRRAL